MSVIHQHAYKLEYRTEPTQWPISKESGQSASALQENGNECTYELPGRKCSRG
jgi:hypothetical protein